MPTQRPRTKSRGEGWGARHFPSSLSQRRRYGPFFFGMATHSPNSSTRPPAHTHEQTAYTTPHSRCLSILLQSSNRNPHKKKQHNIGAEEPHPCSMKEEQVDGKANVIDTGLRRRVKGDTRGRFSFPSPLSPSSPLFAFVVYFAQTHTHPPTHPPDTQKLNYKLRKNTNNVLNT